MAVAYKNPFKLNSKEEKSLTQLKSGNSLVNIKNLDFLCIPVKLMAIKKVRVWRNYGLSSVASFSSLIL